MPTRRLFALLLALAWMTALSLGVARAVAPPPAASMRQASLLRERDALLRQAEKLEAESKYAEAAAAASKAVELTRQAREREHLDLAGALAKAAEHSLRNGDAAGAVKQLEEALSLREKLHGERHWRTGGVRAELEVARRIAALGGEARAAVVAALRRQAEGDRLRRQGKAKEAEALLTGVLETYRVRLGAEAVPAARVLHLLGNMRYSRGDWPEAARLWGEALAIHRKALPEGHPHIAASLSNLGIVQHGLGEHAAARRSHEEALAIWRKALPAGHPDIAQSLNNLGVVQRGLGEHAAARRSHEEALAISRKALPAGHPDIAQSLHNLGVVQWTLGEHAAARRSHEEALAISRKALPAGHPDIAQSLNGLGIVQGDLGEHAAARRSHEEALAIRRKALPKGHPNIAYSLNGLGNVQWTLGEHAAARRSFEEALAIWRKALPAGHPDIAQSLNNLGAVQWTLGEHAAARGSLEEALAIRRKALPAGHPRIAQSLHNLGLVQHGLGEHAAARGSLEEALAIRRKALPAGHPDIALNLHNLGAVVLATGKEVHEARAWIQEAITIRQRHLPRLALAQAEPEQLLAAGEARTSLDLLLSLTGPSGSDQAGAAYPLVVAVKGAVTARQRIARQLRDSSDPKTADLVRQLREVNLALLRSSLGEALEPGRPGRVRDPKAEMEQLRRLGERRARLEQELADRSPAFRRLMEEPASAALDLRATLPSGAALIDFVEYWHASPPAKGKHTLQEERRLLAFVVPPGKGSPVMVPLGKAERLAGLVEAWRASHGSGQPPPPGKPDPAAQLREELWLPLERHLGGAKVVLTSPDGPLNALPLAALPGGKPGTFLLHEYAFAVVPVPRLLPELLTPEPRRPPRTLLLAGGIDFGAGRRAAPAEGKGGLPVLPRFEPLAGTESEVNGVEKQFKDAFPDAPPPTLLRRELATKAAFLKEAGKARSLHLATHGFFAAEPHRPGRGKVTLGLVGNALDSLKGLAFQPLGRPGPRHLLDGGVTGLIPFANGLLDPGRKALLEHTPLWFCGYCLRYPYDPGARCPRWTAALETLLEGDRERIRLLQAWFGYHLVPGQPEQAFLVLAGPGGNGKSVVGAALTAALGEENVSAVPLADFGSRFGLQPTLGKLANVNTEVGRLDELPEGALKAFTGGDLLTVDRKYRDAVQVRPGSRGLLRRAGGGSRGSSPAS
jgi:tetratricopeptide (TPR) repeat protein